MKLLITLTILLASTICFGQGKQTTFDAVQKYNKSQSQRDSAAIKAKADSIANAREYISNNDLYNALRFIKKQINSDDYDEKYKAVVETFIQVIAQSANQRKQKNIKP